MASSSSSATVKKSTKLPKKQTNPEELKLRPSLFELPVDYFDSCRLLQSPFVTLPDTPPNDVVLESKSDDETIAPDNHDALVDSADAKIMQRWSCNTCKAEFESLQDQRLHFKSDLHRFNIKLSVAGKSIIKEEDFDEEASDSLCRDHDVSSISGLEDEEERDNSLAEFRQHEMGGVYKSKLFIQLQNGDKVAVSRCLLLDESEIISFENDKSLFMDKVGNTSYLRQTEVIDKLRYLIREPRDNTRLRIVLMAKGGHFAGCVFDGNSLVANKTFHRYVVRAKAGKKQSSKDGGGRSIHSAGASLRRYNELALKKDIHDLLDLWKPHFAVASNVFISAPSNNRQLFFDGDKPYFVSQPRAIRNIPLTVRRPTLKEAKRLYSLLTQISPVISEETPPVTKKESLCGSNSRLPESAENEQKVNVEAIAEACPIVKEMDDLSMTTESQEEPEIVGISTPLHEAAKLGDSQKVLELLEQGLDPCTKDERGQTPYMLSNEKEVRNTFRRFMASNLDKWDWNAAKVPSALTKEMEEAQAAKQAEKDAKRKAKAKELKKLRKSKEKKAQAEAAQSQISSSKSGNSGSGQPSSSPLISKEEALKRSRDAEREKRAAAAERRIAALQAQGAGAAATPSNMQSSNMPESDTSCSCCYSSLAGKVPFHRYNYKYCSSSCMHLHKEILEGG